MARKPTTRAEWQECVDLADAALHFDSARQYGLVEGGPQFDVARCVALLAEGRQLGIVPSAGKVWRFVAALARENHEETA